MSCGCKQSVHLPSAGRLDVQLPLQDLPLQVAANTDRSALGPVLSGAVPGQLCESCTRAETAGRDGGGVWHCRGEAGELRWIEVVLVLLGQCWSALL